MADAPIRIVVPYDICRLSANQRLAPYERRRRQRDAKAAARFGWQQAGEPVAEGPVIVDLLLRRGRAVDSDSIVSSAKHALDSLFCARNNGCGITPDDSPKWVQLGSIEQEVDKQWKGREELVVTIRPRES